MSWGKRTKQGRERQRLYQTPRWKRLRKHQLAKHPYCQCPHHRGKKVPANTVDHIKAHHGDQKRFFDPNNLQSLHPECHNRFKQSEERGGPGFKKGSDESGEPLDKEHPWYG